jgi:hypothetical protein
MSDSKCSTPSLKEVRNSKLQQLVRKYVSRYGHSTPPLKLGKSALGTQDITAGNGSELEISAALMQASGTEQPHAQRNLITQTLDALPPTYQRSSIPENAILENLGSMKPESEIEGMLCSQILALHSQSMYFMSRVNIPDLPEELRDRNVNRVRKLTGLFFEGVKLLNKIKKPDQKIQVQHVHVSDGGQAIIGDVGKRGGCE